VGLPLFQGGIMSQKRAIRAEWEPLRSLDFSLITNTYMGIGTELDNPARIIRIQNLTDALLFISNDGINDKMAFAPNSFLLLDITANKTQDSGCYLAEGTRFYVKEVNTPTEGAVYVEVIYGAID
jgi:hypothetical protein